MFGKWERVHVSIKTKLRKCPECRALIMDAADDQQAHMEAHFPPEEELIYEYADGVTVERPRRLRDELRDIFRLRPPVPIRPGRDRRAVTAAPADDMETRGAAFRAAMESINGPGGGNATHD